MSDNKNSEYFPLAKLLNRWEREFGSKTRRDFYFSAAPGRVNLIGEHTDYHGGFVFPVAIDLKTYFLAALRPDNIINCHSINQDQTIRFSISDLKPGSVDGWAKYVAANVYALREKQLPVKGLDLVLFGTVPFGGGLSSSASLEVAMIKLLDTIGGYSLSKREIAELGQIAENSFVGVPCGIMDQFISASGKADHALMLDCRSLDAKLFAINSNWKIVALDTGVHHELASSEYAKRQNECAKALQKIKNSYPSISQLRDVDYEMLQKCSGDLSELEYRRSLHVVEENKRVLDFAEALRENDVDNSSVDNSAVDKIGKLMNDSHLSLKDNYEVSCKELDQAVKIANTIPGLIGARMTGGGFGGSTVNLVEADFADSFRDKLEQEYHKYSGGKGNALLLTSSTGAIGGRFGEIR